MKTIKLFINGSDDITKEWCVCRNVYGRQKEYWFRNKAIGPAVYFYVGVEEYYDEILNDVN